MSDHFVLVYLVEHMLPTLGAVFTGFQLVPVLCIHNDQHTSAVNVPQTKAIEDN